MKNKPPAEAPVRVLMVFTILNRGGAETMVMNYLRNIDRSRVIFDFLVHRRQEGAYEREIGELGGRIFRLPALNPLRTRSYKRAVAGFFDAHPEYTMIHGHCSELGYYIYKEAHRRGLGYIAAHAHNSPKGFDFKMPLRNILKRRMRSYLTHFFTCGEESARWLFGGEIAEKAVFLPNAIDSREFAFDPARREKVRRENGWDGRFVVGNISRFSRQKNHLFLIDVFVGILGRDPSALLVLVGSGGDRESRVREKIAALGIGASVAFMGNRTDIAGLLQGMDVFLFPSLFEGLSLSQLEAQAAGIKIVNSDSIPCEGTVIPSLVESLSLGLPADEWARRVLEAGKNYERTDTSTLIIKAGFDIRDNSEWLQNFYTAQSRR